MQRVVQVVSLSVLVFLLIWSSSPTGFATATVEEAVDQNGNCIIEDSEITQAVEYWITGDLLPGTSGLTIDDVKILELIQYWVTGENVCSAPVDRLPRVVGLNISPNPALTSDHIHDIYNYFDLQIEFSDPQRDVTQALIHVVWPFGGVDDYAEPITAQENAKGTHRSVSYWTDTPGTISFTVVVVDNEENHSQPFTRTFPVVTPGGPTPPSSVDTAFLALINHYRHQSTQCWDIFKQAWVPWPALAVRDLKLSTELSDASVYHSQFMADHDCFAHQCLGEADLVARIERAGYSGWWVIAENIAAGMGTPEEAFEAWRHSPPHNRNMLNCDVQEIGVGRVDDPQDRYPSPQAPYRWYWTTDFGSR